MKKHLVGWLVMLISKDFFVRVIEYIPGADISTAFQNTKMVCLRTLVC